LKQSGTIINKELSAHLKPYIYEPVRNTPGLWYYTQTDSIFTLIIVNFLIQYTNLINANHLINVLQQKYNITIDWEAQIYIGITLKMELQAAQITIINAKLRT